MKDVSIKVIYLLIALAALIGLLTSPLALMLGFLFTLIFENPFRSYCQKAINYGLKAAIVGLGFGMFIRETWETSQQGFALTFYSILLTVSLGLLLTKLLKLDLKLGYLITSGTSICGGSAIAAISAVIKAQSSTVSIALGIVFLLNSIALFIFPSIGHWLDLTQEQFGLWCAVAIHDTSSVVGASLDYGEEALRIATTVKLSRTLWIIPLSILSMFAFRSERSKVKIPYFILLFCLAIIINSFHILPESVTSIIVLCSKRLLILTLFIVGSTISIKDLKKTGFKPIALGLCLWIFISVFSLLYITM